MGSKGDGNLKDLFAPAQFFSLRNFCAAEIFAQLNYVWEIFPNTIASYLADGFDGQRNDVQGEVDARAYLVGTGIVIAKGVCVEAGAYVRGPCLLAEGCEVRHGAYLRGNVIAGRGCVLGHATEIKNSVLLDEVKAGHFAYIGDSVLGNQVNLGAGVKLANLKLNPDSTINVHHRDGRVATKLRKFGAVLGDRVQIGCNAVTNPGTVLAPDSQVLPGTVVTGAHLKAGSKLPASPYLP